MSKEYLLNPLNRRKKKYKFYLRNFENYLKFFLIYLFILPLISPLLLKNLLKKNKYLFKDFFNQNAVVFIVSCLNYKNDTVFLFKFFDFHKILSRFGLFFVLKNFSLYFGFKITKELSFVDKNSDYYFNQDYFLFFDKNLDENSNNFVLPFYLRRNFYIQNKQDYLKSLIKSDKKFKIIFSGSSHKEWYGEYPFRNKYNKIFLNRPKILEIIKENFPEKILLIDDPDKVDEISKSNKEILIIETNPDKLKRKKIISEKEHMELISSSNFFLCMPGSTMPLCYHLIETCVVGSVPILSYNDYIYPKFTEKEAMFFFEKNELINVINQALNMKKEKYLEMQRNLKEYYKNNLSPKSIYESISKKKKPLEIFTNLDHTSSRLRNKRFN